LGLTSLHHIDQLEHLHRASAVQATAIHINI